MRYQAVLVAAVLLAGCNPTQSTTNTQARLRNSPPSTCTQDQEKACPMDPVVACPDGSEPVLDYSSDCCTHFSCQPVCVSAKPCPMTPAPVCPAGTKLWIGTAIEDCCPAYRCEPTNACDPTTDPNCACDATGGKCACDPAKAICSMAMPYCGLDSAGNPIPPISVGLTTDCCPIYQCPCDATVSSSTACKDPNNCPTTPDVKLCGCTFPNCQPGFEVVCDGKDNCGGPCHCDKAHGYCLSDKECAADSKCDLSNCLAPPVVVNGPALCDATKCGAKSGALIQCADGSLAGPTDRCLLDSNGTCSWELTQCPPAPATCDAAKCGPAMGMAQYLCPDGKTMAGPSGRCLLQNGRCAWEVISCPPAECDPKECGPALGMPNVLCSDGKTIGGPTGRCLKVNDSSASPMACKWEVISCPPTDPTTCYGVCVPNVQAGCKADTECPSGQKCEIACSGWACEGKDPNGSTTTCACPATDPTCKCDPTTNTCGGQTCEGRCVPAVPQCDPNQPVACPTVQIVCDGNVKPVVVGTDPKTCCPIQQCPSCSSAKPSTCAVPPTDPTCQCTVNDGTDPTTCCPIYRCGKLDPNSNKCL